MNKLFSTPKKAVISTIVIVVIVLILSSAITLIVLSQALIGKTEAENLALQDAGLSQADVSGLHSDFGFENGNFFYEIEFYLDGIEYEYLIRARDGKIVSRDVDRGRN